MSLRSLWIAWRRRRIYGPCLAAPVPLVVLRYHSVGEPAEVDRYLDPRLAIPPDRFREQVRLLAARFTPVTLEEVPAILAGERTGGPFVAVTFDDGYRDNRDVALPILREEGVPATFYVTTGPLHPGRWFWISELWRLVRVLPPGPVELPAEVPGEIPADPDERERWRRRVTRRLSEIPAAEREQVLDRLAERAGVGRGEGLEETFLRPEDLREMRQAGMVVGAHSRTHPHLDRLPAEHHDDEVAGSRRDLEEILGEPVPHFAWPNPSGGGTVNDTARAAAERAGFATAVTSVPGPMTPGVDRLKLPRLGVYAGAQERLLFRLLERRGGR